MSLALDRPSPVARASHRRRPRTPAWLRLPWPLALILGVQTVLSLRLIWTNTAYIDEATYLYAGSQELDHWIHGNVVEDYQLYFSGSPHIYPPIGALANDLGGLAGARILGLTFVLGATCLLYATAANLFDRRTAYLATAIFAALGVTQFLSAFATYDPMALFLLALAAYLVIGRRHDWDTLTATLLVTVAGPAVLALDNATKYATALWDPIIIGLAVCAPALRGKSWRFSVGVGVRFAGLLAAILAMLVFGIGKAKYIHGILQTTVARTAANNMGMNQPASLVLHDAWRWIGLVLIAGALGVIAIYAGNHRHALAATGLILAVAAVAAPLNQARIGTSVSLQKHVVFGIWFGCILAGYAARRMLNWRVPVAIAVLSMLAAGTLYYTNQSRSLYESWPQENVAFTTALAKLVHPGNVEYLIEGYADIPAFYVNDSGDAVSSLQWKEAGTYSARPYYFIDGIRNKAFKLIILDFNQPTDYTIQSLIKKYGGYRIVTYLPPDTVGSRSFYTVWAKDEAISR